MIYVPNVNDYQCVYVRDTNTIRAYYDRPVNNTTSRYVDFYINSQYLYNYGEQTFSQYTTLPTCLDSSVLTDNIYYRNDFADICIVFCVLFFFIVLIPIKILFRLFRRFN